MGDTADRREMMFHAIGTHNILFVLINLYRIDQVIQVCSLPLDRDERIVGSVPEQRNSRSTVISKNVQAVTLPQSLQRLGVKSLRV